MNYTERNKFIDSLCGVGLMFLLVEIFYGIVSNAFTVYSHDFDVVTTWVHIFGAIFLAIAIFVLIRAYKKDNGITAIYGIELLVLAISAALLPASYLEFSYPFNKLNKVFPIAFAAYYVIKLLVVIFKTRKKVNKSKGKKK